MKEETEDSQSKYFRLSRERSRIVYERLIAENEGNRDEYKKLDNRLNNLNRQIANLETEVAI